MGADHPDTATSLNNLAEFRVLYNVDQGIQIVSIERIGQKSGNKLLFQGKEISL